MGDKIRVLERLTEPLPLWVAAGEREASVAGPVVGPEGARTKRIGLFVDAQNVRLDYLDETIRRLLEEGEVRIRRAFGHWPGGLSRGEAGVHLKHAVELRQCPRLTHVGKNAADIAMVVDVMDVLGRDEIDVFALVSSDSDFTPLVQHLKRAGKEVLGFGLANAPESLREACSRFEVIEVPKVVAAEEGGEEPGGRADAVAILRKVVLAATPKKPDGWKTLADVGQALAAEGVSMEVFANLPLRSVCEEQPEFEVKRFRCGGHYVRVRERSTKFSPQEEEILKKVMHSNRGDGGWVRIEVLAKALRNEDHWDFWRHQGRLKKTLGKLGWMEISKADSQSVRVVE